METLLALLTYVSNTALIFIITIRLIVERRAILRDAEQDRLGIRNMGYVKHTYFRFFTGNLFSYVLFILILVIVIVGTLTLIHWAVMHFGTTFNFNAKHVCMLTIIFLGIFEVISLLNDFKTYPSSYRFKK
jgi:hypothetical protein